MVSEMYKNRQDHTFEDKGEVLDDVQCISRAKRHTLDEN